MLVVSLIAGCSIADGLTAPPTSLPSGGRPFRPSADVSRVPGRNSKERAMYLLERTRVASVPGSAFFHGSDGEELVRFCFAKKDEDLDRACRQLENLKV